LPQARQPRHTPQKTPSRAASPGGTPDLASAAGWLVSSFELVKSGRNWEQHPHGDESVHSSSGQCTLLLQTPEGVEAVRLNQGKTVIIPRGTWHTARVSTRASSCTSPAGLARPLSPPQTSASNPASSLKEAL
jgi:hypothetical protein